MRSRQRVAVDVTRAFYQVVEQRALLAVARQSLRRSENLQKASEARLAVGLVSKLDVFRAQLQAAQAEDSMVRAQAALEDALERFRFLLGRPPGDALQPEAVALPEDLPAPAEPLEVLVPRALDNRVDLHESRDEVDDAQRYAALARQNLLPQLDLRLGLVGRGLGPTYRGAWSAATGSSRSGWRRRCPSSGPPTGRRRRWPCSRWTRARAPCASASWRSRPRCARPCAAWPRSARAWSCRRTRVEVAEQQHRLATLRYQRGLASNFDVVEAEESLVLARSALVSLLARYQVERVDLLRALGTLDVEQEFAP